MEVSDHQSVLLFVVDSDLQKGFDILLRALDLVHRKTKSLKLVVCGIGECESQYLGLSQNSSV